jgi:tetratricopeptide (TPR) repeat protein
MKLERNQICICGSGKKNKTCCKLSEIKDDDFRNIINDLANQTLEYNENFLIKAIERFETFLSYPNLKPEVKAQIQSHLIGAYQRRGYHKKALEFIEITEKTKFNNNSFSNNYLTLLKAKSLSSLEKFEEACQVLDKAFDDFMNKSNNTKSVGLLLVEVGKIYINGNEIDKARECLEKSVRILETEKEEAEHYERAKSNLAILMLHEDDKETINKGVQLVQESIYAKSAIGDLEGLGTNYCNLGLHYWRVKDYKGAIAYLRKDIWITRKIGDLHALAISLRNLTSLYIFLKQLKPAKRLAIESIEIGEKINDDAIIEKATFQKKQIEELAKECGINKVKIGEVAPCLCESGLTYEKCCGVADHEPIDFPFRSAGVSEEIKDISKKFKSPSRLDFIFRDSEVSSGRLSWNQVKINNGWYELFELPDMANIYLISAKSFIEELSADEDSIHKPLSCLILAVSSLEAYINQVAFFLDDVQKFPEASLHKVPTEFENGVLEFQRNTELTLKWSILGKTICEEMWTPSDKQWNDFKTLISIRNEFIHFKLSEYEQVVPVPKEPHLIIKKLPKEVETRKVFHSWPMRILTPSFAKWSVSVADEMIKYFKKQYESKRIKAHNNV